MKIWRWLIRMVGGITVLLCLWGLYFQILVVLRERSRSVSNPAFFRVSFSAMSAITTVLTVAMLCTAVCLLTLRRKAVLTYTLLMVAIVAYDFGPGALWLLPEPVGSSVATASGIGSVGLGPLLFFPVPYIYPLASVVLVNLARWRLSKP